MESATEPGACGDWSVSQIFWHVSSWERLLIEALKTPDDGYDYSEPDEDDFNADEIAAMLNVSTREVLERSEATHRELRDTLAATPAPYFEMPHPRRRLIDQWATMHYEEHAAQISAWRAEHGR